MPRPTRTPTAVTNLRSVLGQAASALLIASAILATACADSDRAATSAKPSASPSATPTARPSSGPAAAGSGQGSGAPSAGTAEPIEPVRWHGSRSIVVDGDVADWPQDVAAVADEHWLYLRFMLDGPIRTLQGMDTPVAIWIDADGDPKTGTPIERPTVQGGLGADLQIVFSPRDPDAPRVGQGVLIRLYRPDGSAQRLTHDALDMHFAPTHAAPWYELRLSRAALANLGIKAQGLAGSGRVAGVVVLFDAQGQVRAWADPFEISAPPAKPLAKADVRLPAKPARGLRVLSYNVEHTSPAKNPAPFARVLSVLQPDVMLFQEWVEGDDQALRAWLTAHVDDQTTWHVLKGQAWGVAIASRYPLTPATAVDAPNPVNPQQPLRFLSAFVQTPAGPVLVGTTHLKCCGTKDSREDRQRLTEATTIADMVAKALDAPPQPDDAPAAQPWAVVLGGDMNLVGSRPPLEALAHGTDLDGSDLAVAPAQHLGDPVHYTWFDPGNAFTPGRLDYLLYSDASATAVHAFVLDTTKLGEAALARLGLDPTDTAASDHLPLVLDLVPTPAEGSTPAAR